MAAQRQMLRHRHRATTTLAHETGAVVGLVAGEGRATEHRSACATAVEESPRTGSRRAPLQRGISRAGVSGPAAVTRKTTSRKQP
jgi:hypothetical protein